MKDRQLHSFEQIPDSVLPRVGGKGLNLVKLSRAGLNVPPGFCVPVDSHDRYQQEGKLPDGLVDEILDAKRTLGGKIAVRSSADCEDGDKLTMAGVFETRYIYEDRDVPQAVEDIYRQSRSDEVGAFMELHGKSREDVRMGLVIQKLIEPDRAGVVYTGVNGGNLLIQYTNGFGANLVDGQTQGSAVVIDEKDTILQSTGFDTRPLSKAVVGQISQYTRAIETLFPGIPQDVEFAAQQDEVFILQARTLTTPLGAVRLEELPDDTLEATKHKLKDLAAKEKKDFGTDNAIFSDANYSELLPRPTEMDIGVYMYVWGGSDGIPGAKQLGHSEMGYLVPGEAVPVISYIGGRTYFSIARNAALYHAGFPETKQEYFSTLIQEYLDKVQEDPEKGAYPQMGLYLQDPTHEDLRLRYGDRANEYLQIYEAFSDRMRGFTDQFVTEFYSTRLPETTEYVGKMQSVDLQAKSNAELLEHGFGILEHIRTYSYVDFVRAARLGFYYSQRLPDLLVQKLGMSLDEAKQMYSRLNQGLDGSAITEANIAIAEAPTDAEARDRASQLVGHFNTGEMLEIRHQPLRDVPEALDTYVAAIRQSGNYRQSFEAQKAARIEAHQALLDKVASENRDEFDHAIKSSQLYMALRETNKYLFTKEYLLLRDTLELLGKRTALQSGDIYYLYPRELPQLVAEPESMAHLIRSRRQSFDNYSLLDMPHIIRESDIDSLGFIETGDVNFTEAKGKFLAVGSSFEGAILNMDEFPSLDEVRAAMIAFAGENVPVVLVAQQMNLNHDGYIVQSAGIIIENAGLVAHGAQRAREFGKGAIGGIRSRLLKTGTKVFFDPQNGTVKRIE